MFEKITKKQFKEYLLKNESLFIGNLYKDPNHWAKPLIEKIPEFDFENQEKRTVDMASQYILRFSNGSSLYLNGEKCTCHKMEVENRTVLVALEKWLDFDGIERMKGCYYLI